MHLLEEFESFIKNHGKTFHNDDDKSKAHTNFAEKHDFLSKIKDKINFITGHNFFSDLAAHEINKFKGFLPNLHKHDSANFNIPVDPNLTAECDWVAKGVCNPIQMQGDFGCCYSFSAAACLESQYFIKTGKLVKLSEQNLIDGSTGKYGNQGGDGGTMDNCFSYIIDNGGIDTEASYPYEKKLNNSCKYDPQNSVLSVTSFVDIPSGDEVALINAISKIGPICSCIDASQMSFQLYKEGIYSDPAVTENVDHAILIVGYGSDGKGDDYYIIRNSWGETWGEKGYAKWPRNKGNFGGIASFASYPIISIPDASSDVNTNNNPNSPIPPNPNSQPNAPSPSNAASPPNAPSPTNDPNEPNPLTEPNTLNNSNTPNPPASISKPRASERISSASSIRAAIASSVNLASWAGNKSNDNGGDVRQDQENDDDGDIQQDQGNDDDGDVEQDQGNGDHQKQNNQ